MSDVAAPTAVRFEHRTDEGPVLGDRHRDARGCPGVVPDGRRRASPRRPTRSSSTRAGASPERHPVIGASRCWCRGRRAPLAPGSGARCGCGCAAAGTASRTGASRRRSRPGCSRPGTGRRASSARASSAGWTRRRRAARRPRRARRGRAGAALRHRARRATRPTLNGRRVGDHVLAPGWTSYAHRLRYQTYDVTDLVREGDNGSRCCSATAGIRGRLGFAAAAGSTATGWRCSPSSR